MVGWMVWFLVGCAGSGGGVSTEAPAVAAPSADVVLSGTWTYAADPRGGGELDELYVGSTMVFGPGQTYAFKLDITPKPLQGTYTVRDWGAGGGVLETDYGEGRTNELHIRLHQGEGGVVGFVVRETAAQDNARYYAR